MQTYSNRIAEQNLALTAPTAEPNALLLALNDPLPVLHPVSYHYFAALPKGRRLP
jgi:hypothetical protein